MMGEVDEVFGWWDNINHPYIEVEDTALAMVRFKNGGMANILLSNAQKPGIYCKVHVHGSNGASVGVQTDGGAMFLPGQTEISEAPVNDLWTVPGEESYLSRWVEEDTAHFKSVDSGTYYLQCQLADFIHSIDYQTEPMVTGSFARQTVELFTVIYRSNRDRNPLKFPLTAESGLGMDGCLPLYR